MSSHKNRKVPAQCPKWLAATTTKFPSPVDPNAPQLTNEEKKIEIAKHFSEIMKILGLDLSDESLCKTPDRVAKMYVDEIFSGLDAPNFPELSLIEEKSVSNDHQGTILTKASFTSFCEHHFVPMIGHAFIGYIPHGKVIGLSKIPRIVRFFASRPQLQERLTAQIADSLSTLLETEHVAVYTCAQHFCVLARGIRDESSITSTSTLYGDFKNDPHRKEEFFRAIERMMQQKNFIE